MPSSQACSSLCPLIAVTLVQLTNADPTTVPEALVTAVAELLKAKSQLLEVNADGKRVRRVQVRIRAGHALVTDCLDAFKSDREEGSGKPLTWPCWAVPWPPIHLQVFSTAALHIWVAGTY